MPSNTALNASIFSPSSYQLQEDLYDQDDADDRQHGIQDTEHDVGRKKEYRTDQAVEIPCRLRDEVEHDQNLFEQSGKAFCDLDNDIHEPVEELGDHADNKIFDAA